MWRTASSKRRCCGATVSSLTTGRSRLPPSTIGGSRLAIQEYPTRLPMRPFRCLRETQPEVSRSRCQGQSEKSILRRDLHGREHQHLYAEYQRLVYTAELLRRNLSYIHGLPRGAEWREANRTVQFIQLLVCAEQRQDGKKHQASEYPLCGGDGNHAPPWGFWFDGHAGFVGRRARRNGE